VHVLVIDDPYANRSDAESPVVRERVQEFFTSVANTRIEPGGSLLVTHTRWHPKDLSGWILKEAEDRDQYIEVNLPAINADGEALWPERWPLEELHKKRRGVGPHDWVSLYMGSPILKGGTIFEVPTRYEKPHLEFAKILLACDPSSIETTHSDATGIVVLAMWRARMDGEKVGPLVLHGDVLDVIWVRKQASDDPKVSGHTVIATKLLALQDRWNAAIAIESSRDGKQVIKSLKEIEPRLRIVEIAPYASKWIRAQPVAGAWNEGRVRVPAEASWLGDFLDEVLHFTGVEGGQDDAVDALAHAYNYGASLAGQPVARPPRVVPATRKILPFG
jgi:predicted phage terminase large subunit-like protein